MRGKVGYGLDCGEIYRITPAYAGKSYTVYTVLQVGKDHPRLCGEKKTIGIKGR